MVSLIMSTSSVLVSVLNFFRYVSGFIFRTGQTFRNGRYRLISFVRCALYKSAQHFLDYRTIARS